MGIQLINYDVLSGSNDARVLAFENASDGKTGRFVYEPNCESNHFGRIYTCLPDLSDLRSACDSDRREHGMRVISEFLRELFLFADQRCIRDIEIPLLGAELFADDAQPLMTCYRRLSDMICEAIADTYIEEVYIRLNQELDDPLLDEMDDLIYDVDQDIDYYKNKWAGDEDEPERTAPCGVEEYSVPKSIMHMKETFGFCLDRMMFERGMKPGEFVRRANISRQTLSKMRTRDAVPEKYTALACAIALELNYKETEELLKTAGYCLSDSITADVIVGYFINNQMYDIDAINIVLYSQGLRALGARHG